MSVRRAAILALTALAAGPPAAAQEPERGGFVTRLGTDTLAVERFTRAGRRLEGERVLRVPGTTLIRYAATLDGDGRVTRFEAELFPADRLDGPPNWTSTVEFRRGVAFTLFRRGEQVDTIRVETRPGAVPMLTHAYALVDQMVRQTRRRAGVKEPVGMVYPGREAVLPTWVSPHAGDTVAIGSFHDVAAYGILDPQGRLERYDAVETVVKVVAERVAEPDVAALARAFAARDAAGAAVGPVSPRDAVRSAFGGVTVTVDYSRPSKRGRVVLGGLVPWDQVWRTGADAATHFVTSGPIRVGDVDLPAGTYTLWTLPRRDGALLIVNRQTGQWGTEYDATHDLARIPLTVRTLPGPVERLTIAVVPDGKRAELRIGWDTTEWAVTMEAR